MKKKLVGHLKGSVEQVFVCEVGVTKFYISESGRSTANGLLKVSDIQFQDGA